MSNGIPTLKSPQDKPKMNIMDEQPELPKEPVGGATIGETYFLKRGNTYTVTSKSALDLHEKLPAGNYVVKLCQQGFYLEEVEGFRIPDVIYGNTKKTAERILNTYDKRDSSTGVLLCGQMGSGKTLLAKLVSHLGGKKGIPTVIVNMPFVGDMFNTFISAISQECIVFFDEFEKVYDEEHQQHLLTLFDGVYGNKKLFLNTSNSKWKIDEHMRNRPGRFYYFLEFHGLNYDFVREYCERNLNDEKYIEQVCVVSSLFEDFNFDMLQALVEEVNRYDEPPRECIKFLNTKPVMIMSATYDLTVKIGGKQVPLKFLHSEGKWSGNPLQGDCQIYYRTKQLTQEQIDNDGEDPDYFGNVSDLEQLTGWISLTFNPSEIVALDMREGLITFKNTKAEVVFKKRPERVFNYESLDM